MEYIKCEEVITSVFIMLTKGQYYLTVDNRKFYVVSYCWYDGFKFALGSLNGFYVDSMIEVSTGASAVMSTELTGRKTEGRLFNMFLEKLNRRGICVGELVDDFNSRNLVNIKPWQISLLNI